jgi:lysine/ornithine N-monooxygenase
MCLKSTPNASNLSAPKAGFTLADHCASHGIRPLIDDHDDIVPIELFVRYGRWFQEQLVPHVEQAVVRLVERAGGGFRLTLSTGEEIQTRAVVVATGISGGAHIPDELAALTPGGPSGEALVSHSSQHRTLSSFADRKVAVIGAGQSALESAALLHEGGADAAVLVRRSARFGSRPKHPSNRVTALLPQPRSPLGSTWRIYPFSHAPGYFRYLPQQTRLRLVARVLGPLGAWWLRDRVVGLVPVLDGHAVLRAELDGDGVLLSTSCPDGKHAFMRVDHVLAATGYRVDLSRLDFLEPRVRQEIRLVGSFPELSSCFESSARGLYFVGLPAAGTFGPVMRFVCGAGFAAKRVSTAIGRAV